METTSLSKKKTTGTHTTTTTAVLTAMGIPPREAEWAVRFSLSPHTTEEEIDYAAQRIGVQYDLLKRFQRR